jgi:hypothetical protein
MVYLGKINIMIKKYLCFLLLTISTSIKLFAEEGMIIPSLIAAFESDMVAKGMKLTADDIYNINKASIKDAIIHFDGGCTAEIVSQKGLILTNHHCGYDNIQFHSSLENDYLKNGFWAKNLSEELPNPGLTATRIVRIEDVTSRVLLELGKYKKEELTYQKLQSIFKEIGSEAIKGTHYESQIKAFNYGNDYYMMVKETFKDVRLVGTPPNAIGKFGGDTDNWVWPRHTGDFSVFRIYANKDNLPAEYAKDNVPYKPVHSLPISFKNRAAGDFTMVYGFPGTTEQHLVSSHLAYLIEKERPARINMRKLSLSVIDEAMTNSDEVRIKYAAKQARIANAYKKWIGQLGGLEELNALDKKLAWEKSYQEMADSKQEWKSKYGSILTDLKKHIDGNVQVDFEFQMTYEYFYYGPELFALARKLNELEENYTSYVEKNILDKKIKEFIDFVEGHFKNYDKKVDKGIFKLLTKEYDKKTGEMLPDYFTKDFSTSDLTKAIYSKSILTDKERILDFIDKLKASSFKKLAKDSGYKHFKQINNHFRNNLLPAWRAFSLTNDELIKTYIAGLKEMFPDKKLWPDANGTLRISYGVIEGSSPIDGMSYTEHTTTDGIIQKHKTGNPDFELLPDMKKLYLDRNFGPYAQNGDLWVCFTGSNHTTGGNSGSPVIDANGALMGLNFDRSWESTMSDYMFDSSRCRNIVVDIRYVLWVMDIYAGAGYLVDEMVLEK